MLSTLPEQKYSMSLQQAIVLLEVFITSIKNIARARDRAPATEEIETRRESTFKVALAFEEFPLNYNSTWLEWGPHKWSTTTKWVSLITIYSVGPDDEVQVTERKALLLDQIDPSRPSIDYFHSSVIMELDNNVQRFELFKMLLL